MNNIEHFLYSNGGWMKAGLLAQMFGMSERDLRGADSPIRDFAISGDKGYRHIANATPDEISHFCARLTAHATEELKRVQKIKEIRRDINQGVLGRENPFRFGHRVGDERKD